MDRERLWSLINQELDGQISPAEKEELGQELGRSDQARHLMEQLRELARELDALKEVDPPEAISPSVMSVVSRVDRSTLPPSSRGLVARLGISPVWLYPLAAGLLVGLLIGNLWRSGSVPSLHLESLYGTIGSDLKWQPLAREAMGHEQVEVSRFGSQILLEIEVSSPEPLELEFHFDPEHLGLKGLSCPSSCGVRAAAETLSVLPRAPGRHAVLFELPGQSAGSLQLHLRKSGLLSHQSSWVFEQMPGSPQG